MKLDFTSPHLTPLKPPGVFTLGLSPAHRGVCGRNQNRAGALDLLGMSQASSVAMESGCLWPQKLTQDLRAHTQTLTLSPSGTARDREDPREQEVRDGEREREPAAQVARVRS